MKIKNQIKNIKIGKVNIGYNLRPKIIAEAAVEHLGSIEVAKKMALEAKNIGVDFIKYQMHLPESEMLPNKIKFWGGSLDDILDKYNLTIQDHEELINYCKKIGIQYLCTPFCAKAVDILNELGVNGFKIGSGELTNIPIFQRLIATGKPFIFSSGMASLEEIEIILGFLKKQTDKFIMMNCTSLYPCPHNKVNLDLIRYYRDKYDILVGHSDHTPDISTAIASASIGACVIEKHFTLNRSMKGPDYEVSIEPSEFKTLVSMNKKIYFARGGKKVIHQDEFKVKKWANHSIVSKRTIKKGEKITQNNICVKRPKIGIDSIEFLKVIGTVSKKNIKKNTPIFWKDLKKI